MKSLRQRLHAPFWVPLSIPLIGVLGAIGGFILAPGWAKDAGIIVGCFGAVVVGVLFIPLCIWLRLSILLVSVFEFVFAVGIGLLGEKYWRSYANDWWPSIGQIIGGILGCIVAFAIRCPYREPGRCLNCDYLLVNLAESRCPECGRPFDPLRVRRELADDGNVQGESGVQ